jgi:protein-S-isoprenylcysteine O-methyltransferase Ste14
VDARTEPHALSKTDMNLLAASIPRARAYFLVQAAGGVLWWVAVFASDDVRRWTLGQWDPNLLVGPDLVLFVGCSAVAGVLGSRRWAIACVCWTTMVTAALTAYGLVERQAGWGVVAMVLATVGSLGAAATLWFGRLPLEWLFVGPFAFREADNRARRAHVRQSLAQLVLFWTAFLVALPVALAWAERRLHLSWTVLDRAEWQWIGVTTFMVASAFGLWSCTSMALRGEGTPLPAATARHLVVAGPYRIVRNPMAVAGAIQTVGVGCLLGSWFVLASAVVGALVWNSFIRPAEEADLAVRFGSEYDLYRSSVRCWIP